MSLIWLKESCLLHLQPLNYHRSTKDELYSRCLVEETMSETIKRVHCRTGRSSNQSEEDSWSHRHIIWMGTQYFTRAFGYEEAVCKMVAAFAHTWAKRQRWNGISTDNLRLFNRNPMEFLRWFITTDETWAHRYTSEYKELSGQLIEKGKIAVKKVKVTLSFNKVMNMIFWDAFGIIFIDYFKNNKTVNGEYYTVLLQHLSKEIKEKHPHLLKKKVLFHRDNASAHTLVIAMPEIYDLRFKLLSHLLYSPDLATSNYLL